jgi:hypothetical protein
MIESSRGALDGGVGENVTGRTWFFQRISVFDAGTREAVRSKGLIPGVDRVAPQS